MNYEIRNLDDMNRFAAAAAPLLRSGDVIELRGGLGAGKTTLVQMFSKVLGVEEPVTSPTFALVNVYRGVMPIYHLDLYRLERPEEIETLAYEEYFYPDGITFIEWAERVKNYLPEDTISIVLEKDSETTRIVTVEETTERSVEICKGLKT